MILFKFLLFQLVFLLFLSFPVHGSQIENQDSYHQWLRDYGAMDIYAMSVKERESGPDGQLEYAEALISMGNPETAVSVLRSIDVSQSPELEGKVHWVMHRALRQLENFDQSILAVLEASKYLRSETIAELMKNEPGLRTFWSNVWKKWYFQTLTPGITNEGRRVIMEDSALLAKTAWPDDSLWSTLSIPLADSEQSLPAGNDHIQISRALAMWSIGHWTQAEKAITGIDSPEVKVFFENLSNFLRDPDSTNWDKNLESGKSRSFYAVYSDHIMNYAVENFQLSSPGLGSWDQFLEQIKGLSITGALDLIRKELASALLAQEVRGQLEALQFIYELQLSSYEISFDSWHKSLDKSSDLPFTLFLAAALVHQDISWLEQLPEARYPFFKEILNAAGYNPDSEHMADFWAFKADEIDAQYKEYPLDYAVNFMFFDKSFQDSQDQTAARNLAFLFPHSERGQYAFLYLARHAYKEGNKSLAWRYLQNISQDFAQGERQLEILEAKAGILMDMGQEDDSLETYQTILDKDPGRISYERRLRLALLAQEKKQWDTAQKMLEAIWTERDNVPTEIQAEVLFWLGEGAQLNGNIDEALDYYLRLSW
ncbi:MAG: tetratricopeptide repeat protein, partial [Desulfonatronovibrio sp.]